MKSSNVCFTPPISGKSSCATGPVKPGDVIHWLPGCPTEMCLTLHCEVKADSPCRPRAGGGGVRTETLAER